MTEEMVVEEEKEGSEEVEEELSEAEGVRTGARATGGGVLPPTTPTCS